MAVVLVDVKEEVDFFFGLCGRRTEASSAANFSFKSGGVDCRIVARSGLYYDIRICWFAVQLCGEGAIFMSLH